MTTHQKQSTSSDDDSLNEKLTQAVQRATAIIGHRPAAADEPCQEPHELFDHLASLLFDSYVDSRSMDALEESIRLYKESVLLFPHSAAGYDDVLFDYAHALSQRYKLQQTPNDLRERIEILQQCLELRPSSHPLCDITLSNLAFAFEERYSLYGDESDLNKRIDLHYQSLELHPPGNPHRASSLNTLVDALRSRYARYGGEEDLEKIIDICKQSLELSPPGHFLHDISLNNFANALSDRYARYGEENDLRERIELHTQALELRPPGHPFRLVSLSNLANAISDRYARHGKEDDIRQRIELHTEALELCPPGHPFRDISLNNLAMSLGSRYSRYGEENDLRKRVELFTQALELRPPGHPLRDKSLSNLANALGNRYARYGEEYDLKTYIELHIQGLELRPPGHPLRDVSLSNLAAALGDRYTRYGEENDLRERIELLSEALELRPRGHPLRDISFSNLANAFSDRYARYGEEDDLRKQIQVQAQALELRPPGHPLRDSSLNSLAKALGDRYARYGEEDDLRERIELNTQSLELHPPGHPLRDISLNNLAASLKARYARYRKENDLREQIDLLSQALELRPSGHPLRNISLNNLAAALRDRYERYDREDDLRERIELQTQALELCPPGHPSRDKFLTTSAIALGDRYTRYGEEEDLIEQIKLHSQALDLRPPGHALRSHSLIGLAKALGERYTRYGEENDLTKAFTLLETEVNGSLSTENGMLRCALQGVDLADRFGHHSLGKAFVKAIGCLRRYLSIGPTTQLQYEAILRQTELAFLSTDAAAYFIGEQNVELAIELLDEGRSLLWSEMRRFRETLSPFYEERIGEALSTHYRTLCKEISNLSNAEVRFRNYSAPEILEPASNALSSAVAYDGILKEKREKLKEYNSLLEEIRLIPGCEDFQTRRHFSELQTAAKEGPVIIINCSKRRSDVIIIFADRQPLIVPLEESFRTDMLAVHKSYLKGLSDMTDENSASADPILEFSSVLEEVSRPLWDLVICLVVEELKKANVPKGSRIWWCPTSFLTSLPLHAAGNDHDFLADHFISSYTPTLGALIDARRSFGSSSSSSSLRMLVVAQTKSSGLKHAKKEAKRMVALGSFVQYLDEQDATPESVAASLPSYDWAHFICHGTVSDNPFDSCLILHGQSRLSLNDIIKAHLPNAKFAFLAACHTAELNRGRVLQDEVLHLAAAMQFSGFRSVVGTMWQMEDKDGPRMAEAFYGEMLSGDEEDGERHTRAARALWKAMQMLKKKNVPMARWANYVHIGA